MNMTTSTPSPTAILKQLYKLPLRLATVHLESMKCLTINVKDLDCCVSMTSWIKLVTLAMIPFWSGQCITKVTCFMDFRFQVV